MKTAIHIAGFIAAALAPTVLFFIFTRPIKHPNPRPPTFDGGIPVSKP
jgi:hypothetical protein